MIQAIASLIARVSSPPRPLVGISCECVRIQTQPSFTFRYEFYANRLTLNTLFDLPEIVTCERSLRVFVAASFSFEALFIMGYHDFGERCAVCALKVRMRKKCVRTETDDVN